MQYIHKTVYMKYMKFVPVVYKKYPIWIVMKFRWLLLSLYMVVFFRLPEKKNHIFVVGKKPPSTWDIKNMVVKWVSHKICILFCFKYVDIWKKNGFDVLFLCLEIRLVMLLILKRITSKKPRQWELDLVEPHLRKSFGRWEERGAAPRGCISKGKWRMQPWASVGISGLWALNLILLPASERRSINLGVCPQELQNWWKAGKQALWIKDEAEYITLDMESLAR